jgi:hypothetical protein
MATAYHMIHYRKFEGDADPLATLEVLCRTALGRANAAGNTLWTRADDRMFDLRDETGGKILLNKVADLSSAVFGEMCFVESRGLQALLHLTASKVQLSDLTVAEIYDLQERSAPSGSQFIRGLAYWLSIGNHLLFVKTQAMTPDRIHAYLNWLLKECTRTAAADLVFRLRAELDRAAHAGDVGDIRRLKLSGNSPPRMVAAIEEEHQTRVRQTERSRRERKFVTERAEQISRLVFGERETQSLLDTLGPNEYLAAEASIAVRGRRTEASKRKMRELVDQIADESDAKIQVEGKDGQISDGDAILRTRMPFNVPHDGSSLLDFENVADQLQEVYSRFVLDGKIVA